MLTRETTFTVNLLIFIHLFSRSITQCFQDFRANFSLQAFILPSLKYTTYHALSWVTYIGIS